MKNIYSFLLLMIAFTTQADDTFGKKISASKKSLKISQLEKKMQHKKEMKVRLEGTVEGVCKAAGCWLTIQNPDGKAVRVTFKDYAFFVPKDIEGKKVVVEGLAYKTTTTVAELQHFAEDAGKSKEEIAKINKDVDEISFEAEGVLIKN